MSETEKLSICFISSREEAPEIVEVLSVLGEYQGPLGVDTETTGLSPHSDRVRLIQVASPDVALVVDLEAFRSEGRRRVDWSQPGLKELAAWLSGGTPKVLQNAAFDLNFLRGEGIVLGGSIFDTMIASKVLNNGHPNRNSLDAIAARELGAELSKEQQKADWGGELSAEMVLYAARDAAVLPQLVEPLKSKLKASKVGLGTLWDVFRLEEQCLRAIAAMQWFGFRFDRARGEALREALQVKAQGLMEELLEVMQARLKALYPKEPGMWLPLDADGSFNTRTKDSGSIRLGTKKYAGFNPRSPQQMVEKLTALGVILPPNEKGVPSMDQNLLAFIRKDDDLIDRYLIWKEAATQVTHIEKLLDSVGPTGRIHANYRQVGTDTGRLSCIAKGQKVLAPNGPIPIEDIKVGDNVYALDDEGRPLIKRVLNTWCNGIKEVVRIKWEASGHREPKYGELVCTADHLIRTDEGWIKAAELLPKQAVWHLRRSATPDRPRLYYRNKGCKTEQLVIKEQYFGKIGGAWHIHHKDHDKTNNCLDNLEVLTHSDHCSHHARSRRPEWLFTPEVIAKSQKNRVHKTGADTCNWIAISKYQALRMIAKSRGRLTYIAMDFDTFKRKCKELDIDVKKACKRYSSKGIYLNKRNVQAVYEAVGTVELAAKYLGIGTRKLNSLMLDFGILRTNHKVLSVTPCGEALVYDLEVEDAHNFIAEEICVHNCAGPNLQQVPREKEFRSLFIPENGWKLVVADFSQIELRVAAELSEEPRMLEAYRDERDLHTETAALITKKSGEEVTKEERTSAKLANFGLLYGAGAATLKKQAIAQYGIDISMKEAQELVKGFRTAYPRLYQWQVEAGEGTTRSVFTRYGRRRILVGRNDKFTTRINTQVQGTAGDIAKVAIAKLWQQLRRSRGEARLIAMVHDEIVLEVKEGVVEKWAETLKRAMEEGGAVVCSQVPIVAEVDTGETWAEAK